MMANKPMILKSPLTDRWYFVRAYKDLGNGVIEVTGKKEDITEQMQNILSQYGVKP